MKYGILLFTLLLSSISILGQETIISLSDDLQIIQISQSVYIHKSFTNSEQFGRYSSNGLIFINNEEVLIADTPPSVNQSEVLLKWISDKNLKVKAVVVNHHHEDALGGLEVFQKRNIQTYGYVGTTELAEEDGFLSPTNTFSDSMMVSIGNEPVKAFYFGEAHTSDNIVLWLPNEHILFGGCMIKSLGSGKGNLADANVEEWSKTVQKVKNYFRDIKLVIPGHGNYGETDLLDYTIEMFRE